MLQQYQHMPSFHGIQEDCTAIVRQLKSILKKRLNDQQSSTSIVAETVDLLLELNEPVHDLCQQFLDTYVRNQLLSCGNLQLAAIVLFLCVCISAKRQLQHDLDTVKLAEKVMYYVYVYFPPSQVVFNLSVC